MVARRLLLLIIVLFVGVAAAIGLRSVAGAQEDDERSQFVQFVERQISTPDRQIRLGEIEGALSSDVRISSITIADREGVWLSIEDVHLIWSRAALLGGRLDIDLLEAGRIDIARRPLPAEAAMPDAEFELPEIPVTVEIDSLNVPVIDIAAGVIGPAAALGVEGRMELIEGTLDAELAIERRDEPGSLRLQAAYSNETQILDLSLNLSEPENGVVANLLNLQGRPAITFIIDGSGPLDDFEADISLAADGDTLISGDATISRVSDGFRFLAEVDGNLQRLVPSIYADLFDDGSSLNIDATRTDDGSIRIARADVRSGVAALTISGDLAPDGFPTQLRVDGTLGTESGERVNLPGGGGAASIRSGQIMLSLGGEVGQSWTATFDVQELETPTFSARSARITGSGLAARMADPHTRRITFDISGAATGLSSQDEDVALALGDAIDLEARGGWSAGERVEVESASLSNPNAEASFTGEIGAEGLDGNYTLAARNLALFSGLVGQDLEGSVDLSAQGSVGLRGRRFSLSVDGSAQDLETGIAALDGLFAGESVVSGTVSRDSDGFRFGNLAIRNAQSETRIDGVFGRDLVDLEASARLTDVSVLTDRAAGAADLRASLSGTSEVPAITAVVEGDGLTLMGRPFTDARATFDGTVAGADVNGDIEITGVLDQVPVDASTRIQSLDDGTRQLHDFHAEAGDTSAQGNLVLRPDGLYSGELSMHSPDLSAIGPLLLAEASGALSADIVLSVEDGGQSADITAQARALRYEQVTIASADVDVAGENLFSAPILAGRAAARDVSVGEIVIEYVEASASRSGETTAFTIEADLVEGTLAAEGSLQPIEGGFAVALGDFRLDHRGVAARLVSPVNVTIRNGNVSIPQAGLQVGSGRIDLSGEIGDVIDLSARVADLPLSLANAFAPGLGLQGSVSGDVEASGTLAAPVVDFQVTGGGISAEPLRRLGVGEIAFDAQGRLVERTVTLEASADIGGGRVNIAGSIGDDLDVTADVAGLPLSIFDTLAPELDLAGSVSGTIEATGSLANPQGTFRLAGQGVSADMLRQAGISAVAVTAEGRFADETVTLTAGRAEGGGLSLEAIGTVPVRGGGLDLALDGSVPLSLADRFVAERGARLGGTLTIDAQVTGSLAEPRLAGGISADGLSFADPQSGLLLTNVVLRARLDGQQVVIETLTAGVGTGSMAVTGSVSIDPGSGFPADLVITLRQARYDDGRLIAATLDGDLTFAGPLTGVPVLGGEIRVARAEITVPERLPGGSALLDVSHVGAPPAVLATLERAGIGPYADVPRDETPSGIRLDLTIDAPARIFVRGRGIDAELGGSVTLTGPVSAVRPVGAFEMRRGRINILGQRITFDRGNVTLFGDLDPYLDFVAATQSNSITVTVTVDGRASDPEISFSSVPDLPQDEVLAQLLFGRSLADLSPLQIAQLAAAAAELAGATGGPGVLDQIRSATGLDNLEIVTETGGGTAVAAGRYIDENIYLGVRAGEESSGVTVNLDVTEDLKIRGEAGQRDSSIGVFFEREY